MIARQAADTLKRLEKGFPVLCVTGPRQSGKTTLAKASFPDKPYLSLAACRTENKEFPVGRDSDILRPWAPSS